MINFSLSALFLYYFGKIVIEFGPVWAKMFAYSLSSPLITWRSAPEI